VQGILILQQTMMQKNKKKLILLGLDGAAFPLLDPYMEEGVMPNLRAIHEQGAWGELASTMPATTPPAWASCCAGVNPGRHGIVDFRESPKRDRNRPMISSRSVRMPRIWHLLNRNGRTTVMLNVPLTYPPEPVDGAMISGLMTPDGDQDYTFPRELAHEMKQELGDYIVNVDIPRYDTELPGDAQAFLDDVERAFDLRVKAHHYLQKRFQPDFLMTVFILTDRIQHLFWKYLDPEFDLYNSEMASLIRPRIKELYKKLDGAVGDIAGNLPADSNLIILSDHGFGGTESYFNVNQWLQDNGWLKVKSGAAIKKRIFFSAMKLNDQPWVKRFLPNAFQSWFRSKVRGTRSSFKSDLETSIDWDHTRAYFPSIPSQGIYLTKPDPALLDEIEAGLREVTDDSGKKVIDQIWHGEELYHGAQAEYMPDIVFLARDYRILGRPLLNIGERFSPSLQTPLGFHRSQGILFGLGADIQPGMVTGAKIEDTMPTALYLMGEPIPEKLDGQIIPGFVKPEQLTSSPPKYCDAEPELQQDAKEYSPEEEKSVEDRLRALGYL
jgi:predicted AlkP superfamily phosphohydrolase/phosphomutase